VASGPVVDALLLDLPAALWATTAAHTQRVLETAAPVGSPVSALRDLVTRMKSEYGAVIEPAEAELAAAAARVSHAPVDVAYPIPRAARDGLAGVLAAWEAVDVELRAGGDAALVPPEGVMEFRRWFLGELIRQIDGAFPTPWPGRSSAG
jgi:hypothetical protein